MPPQAESHAFAMTMPRAATASAKRATYAHSSNVAPAVTAQQYQAAMLEVQQYIQQHSRVPSDQAHLLRVSSDKTRERYQEIHTYLNQCSGPFGTRMLPLTEYYPGFSIEQKQVQSRSPQCVDSELLQPDELDMYLDELDPALFQQPKQLPTYDHSAIGFQTQFQAASAQQSLPYHRSNSMPMTHSMPMAERRVKRQRTMQ